jgi:hypothetical protein
VQLTFSDPFQFFDLIYCINLDSRPDRWQEAVRAFSAVGILDRVERVAAIIHPDPREGCRLSHLECVRRAEAAGAEKVLIFEDDVVFRGFSYQRLAQSLKRLCTIPDWELFYLGGYLLATPESYGDLMRVPMAMTHAYAIHRRAFGKIQESTTPYDIWLAMNMKSYCAHPLLALQRDGFSDLEKVWIYREGQEIHAYMDFVANPKAKTFIGEFLRRRIRWRLFRRRVKLRIEGFAGRLISALGLRGSILSQTEEQGDSPSEKGAE